MIAPPPMPYPKAGSLIKPTNKNPLKVKTATNDVYATAHKAAIQAMGGCAAVAAAILGAINSVIGICSIGSILQVMQMLQMMQGANAKPKRDAVYAILLKLA